MNMAALPLKVGFVSALLLTTAFALPAQGLINNGARIVTTTGSNIYINGATGNYTSQAGGLITPASVGGNLFVIGNWVNNAGNAGFSADGVSVYLTGAAQSIGGSASTSFYNLYFQGSSTKTLNINTTVGGLSLFNGVLDVGARPLDLNSYVLTLSNPAAGAVTNTTGYIISETNAATNPSIVRWQMGTTTGAHTIPFGTVAGISIPFVFNKIPATAATIDIATRPTAASNNNPWASGVSHMYDPNLVQDGSDEAVIDRWWEINSTAAITANLTFRYRGNTENTLLPAYNTGTLGAQYWASGAWLPDNAILGSGTGVTAGVGVVTANGVSIAAAYTPWVLSSQLAPLPVEWLTFTTTCTTNNALVKWSTATEQNNDYFTVQRSTDGFIWDNIGTVNGAGNSSQVNAYTFVDPQLLSATTYYRIRQTDYNGQHSYSSLSTLQPCGTTQASIDAFSASGQVSVAVQTTFGSDYSVQLFDTQGRLVREQQFAAREGANRFELLGQVPATGIYMVTVTSAAGERFSKKLFITRN